MTDRSSHGAPSSADRFLDLLLDALAERQRQRGLAAGQPVATASDAPGPAPEESAEATRHGVAPEGVLAEPVLSQGPGDEEPLLVATEAEPAATPVPDALEDVPASRPSIGMDRLLRRMLIGLLIAVVAINIPVAAHGVSLARILPDTAALVIRDGLVLKGSGDRIYMLQDEQLRWITSLDAFDHLGLTWEDVHVVDDAFLARFEVGRPIDILLKCDGSPHIYVLREGTKHWIKDIATFTAEGYVWEDVTFVSCSYLRGVPDGAPIPPDAGPPPHP